jgi:hypothetical protein
MSPPIGIAEWISAQTNDTTPCARFDKLMDLLTIQI